MAEYSCPITLVTPGGNIVFNAASGDRNYLDPERCSGLDMPTMRAVSEDKARTHGALTFDTLNGKWAVVLAGLFLPGDGSASSRNAMESDMRTKLLTIRSADGSLQQTPSGMALRTLTGVRLEVGLAVTGGFLKAFTFSVHTGVTDWA